MSVDPALGFSVQGLSNFFRRLPSRALHQVVRNEDLPFARGFVFEVVSFHFRNQLPMPVDMVKHESVREKAIDGQGMAQYLVAYQAQIPEALRAYKVPFLGTEWRDKHLITHRSHPYIFWNGTSWVVDYFSHAQRLGPDWRLLRVKRRL